MPGFCFECGYKSDSSVSEAAAVSAHGCADNYVLHMDVPDERGYNPTGKMIVWEYIWMLQQPGLKDVPEHLPESSWAFPGTKTALRLRSSTVLRQLCCTRILYAEIR